MPLIYIGRSSGFASRTFSTIHQTPFLDGFLDLKIEKRRSPVTQTLIEDDLREFTNKMCKPDDPLIDLAISYATRKFQLPTPVKMLHLNDLFKKDLDIWNKSPGLPWTTYGIKTKGELRTPERIREIRHFWHQVKLGDKYHFPDSCAFVRSHICGLDEHKVRAVWGYPATVTFGEAVFALPLIEAYQRLPMHITPMAYGFETFKGGSNKLIRRFARPYDHYFIGLDFRKFDKTVPSWLINVAFDILSVNIDFVNYADYGVADARNMYRMYAAIRKYFIHTSIRLASGRRFRKTSGIASGSYFTQLIGSICNCIILYYISLKQHGQVPQDDIYQGDDSFLVSSKKWNMTEVVNLVKDTFGMNINMQKSQISKNINEMKFLGYTINCGLSKKPVDDLLAALVFPETPDKHWDQVASRALGLYYANLGMDQDFSRISWNIVSHCEFTLIFGRNFERMLKYIGVDIDARARLPVPAAFVKRLLYYG